jgi:TfoX/Sxy family transcriptional regulator of competence genes
MNTGGSPRVAVDASVGAKLANLIWVGVGLLAAGIVFAFVAAGLIHLGVRRSKAPAQP